MSENTSMIRDCHAESLHLLPTVEFAFRFRLRKLRQTEDQSLTLTSKETFEKDFIDYEEIELV